MRFLKPTFYRGCYTRKWDVCRTKSTEKSFHSSNNCASQWHHNVVAPGKQHRATPFSKHLEYSHSLHRFLLRMRSSSSCHSVRLTFQAGKSAKCNDGVTSITNGMAMKKTVHMKHAPSIHTTFVVMRPAHPPGDMTSHF